VSRIAAGEIVERPASVVKELIENSLDASSTSIRIEIKSGGRRLVRVTDDGEGMTRDDALLALERHATSKLRTVEDLTCIETLGFRGEALPSIASVSRLELVTKPEGSLIGTRVIAAGGRIKRVEEIGCPRGTTVAARDLFFNTPPRLKFLKSPRTELSHTIDIVEREAASYPHVEFELISDGKTLLHLARRGSVEERLRDIWSEVSLFEVGADGHGARVSGFLSPPEETMSTTQRLHISVNGRSVRDKFLTRMVIEAYGRLIEKGRYPQGFISIELDPNEVDVNVHPTKNEVRFRRPQDIGELVKSAIDDMLTRALSRGSGTYYYPGREIGGSAQASYEAREPLPHQYNPASPSLADQLQHGLPTLNLKGFFGSLRVVGQVGGLYIICESPSGIYIIDQHAAHERINYERLKRSIEEAKLETQELLIPRVIELRPQEASQFREYLKELASLGIRLEDFGGNTFCLRSLPILLAGADAERLLRDIATELMELGSEKSLSLLRERIMSTMACHSSVRGSDRLKEEEMTRLLKELDEASFPHTCPHGRPVAREIKFGELERMFKRS
jgi:DNA mismatch repair protein MutL